MSADRLAEARAAIAAPPYDAWASAWANARPNERRLLLEIAYLPPSLALAAWENIDAEYRGQIKRRAADMRDWLGRLCRAGA